MRLPISISSGCSSTQGMHQDAQKFTTDTLPVASSDLENPGRARLSPATRPSSGGKVVSGVAAHTSAAGKPLVALVGCTAEGAEEVYGAGVSAVFTTNRACLPFEALKERAADDYRAALRDLLSLIRLSERL